MRNPPREHTFRTFAIRRGGGEGQGVVRKLRKHLGVGIKNCVKFADVLNGWSAIRCSHLNLQFTADKLEKINTGVNFPGTSSRFTHEKVFISIMVVWVVEFSSGGTKLERVLPRNQQKIIEF